MAARSALGWQARPYSEHNNTPRSMQNRGMRAGPAHGTNMGRKGLLGALAQHGRDPRATKPCNLCVGDSIELERLPRATMDADSQASVGNQAAAENERRRPRQIQNPEVATAESVEGGRIYFAMADADVKSSPHSSATLERQRPRPRKIHNRAMTAAESIKARMSHHAAAAADITCGKELGGTLEHRGGRPPKLQNRKMTAAELIKERMAYRSATGLDSASGMDSSATGDDRGQHAPVLQCFTVIAGEPIEQDHFSLAKINMDSTRSPVMSTGFDSVLGIDSMRSTDSMGSTSMFDHPRGYQPQNAESGTTTADGQTMKDERGSARASTQMSCWWDGKLFRATSDIEAIRLSRWLRFSEMASGSEESQSHGVVSL